MQFNVPWNIARRDSLDPRRVVSAHYYIYLSDNTDDSGSRNPCSDIQK